VWRRVHLVLALGVAMAYVPRLGACTIVEVKSPLNPMVGILKATVMRNGRPLAGVKGDLYLGGEESSGGLVLESLLTGDGGEAVVRNLPFGSYEGLITGPDGKTLRLNFRIPSNDPIRGEASGLTVTLVAAARAQEEVAPRDEVRVDRATLALQAVRRAFLETSVPLVSDLRGFVQDVTGAVIQRVEIELYRSGEKLELVSKARTDDIGQFTINAPDGSYVVKFSSHGFMNAYVPIEVKQGGWAGMKLTMQTAATDSCGFDRDGQPMERFRIEPI
jgi:hypothetical protein